MNRSEKSKKKPEKDLQKVISFRLKLLFAVIAVLFLVLLGKLFDMQILNKSFYQAKLAQVGIQTTVTVEQPRGQIFDAKGQVLAATTITPSVTFTRTENVTTEQMRQSAQKLAPILQQYIDDSTLTRRDKADFYLADLNNLAKIAAKIPASEQVNKKTGQALTAGEVYTLETEKVPDSDLNFSTNDLLAAALFKQMNGTALYSTSNIVSGNITAEQQAQIAQDLSGLPGIALGTSWDHAAADNNLLSPLIGTISTTKAGLPADKLSDYLAKGYARNDRVGTSYLEQGYESYLQGKDQITKINADAQGKITKQTTLQKGQSGQDLKLTVDMAFENGVQGILQNEMNLMISQGFGKYATGAYAVVMNPSTGAILSMNGLDRDVKTGQMTNNSLATMTDIFTPGSVVKPGTLTAGWESGAITGNQVIDSQPIQFAGSQLIQDWYVQGFGPIPADVALEYSSNTYMSQVAIKMLGQNYSPNMTLSDTNRVKVYDEFRQAYGQYGLGVSTGIDIPGESTGLIPPTSDSNTTTANAIFESFGQFDNYTPLQLAQYASTIANNGTRMAPHIVQGIYQNNGTAAGTLVKEIGPQEMGKVNISAADMATIKQGMYEVVHGDPNWATGAHIAAGTTVSVSAKTGTSQSYVTDPSTGALVATTVNNVIAFAPSNNPQIAIGLMVPNTTVGATGIDDESHISQYVTADIVNLYNSMYKFK